ncbi:18776_t:CDS:1 [Funneliformis geosporum]|uniref:14886_t:CDS:1 n=1 Tax=Funneliformis geosporum TaxID=1117311 RepID=A0A9W4SSN6_9GLOM|nr:18776_t:CDS:1 [Funneliformis geosporum]CAI2180120.1 14886_t:CDS:1 [Funneliformis geosporum]
MKLIKLLISLLLLFNILTTRTDAIDSMKIAIIPIQCIVSNTFIGDITGETENSVKFSALACTGLGYATSSSEPLGIGRIVSEVCMDIVTGVLVGYYLKFIGLGTVSRVIFGAPMILLINKYMWEAYFRN